MWGGQGPLGVAPGSRGSLTTSDARPRDEATQLVVERSQVPVLYDCPAGLEAINIFISNEDLRVIARA